MRGAAEMQEAIYNSARLERTQALKLMTRTQVLKQVAHRDQHGQGGRFQPKGSCKSRHPQLSGAHPPQPHGSLRALCTVLWKWI